MALSREIDLTIEHVKEYVHKSKPPVIEDVESAKEAPPVKPPTPKPPEYVAPPVKPPTPKPPEYVVPPVYKIAPIQQAPVQQKDAYLICQRTGHEYHITRAQYSIGAGKNVDILTPDNIYVGRKHATLYKEGSQYYLVDENSKNGTRVNGERLYPNEKFSLGESVRIEFADEVYRFEIR